MKTMMEPSRLTEDIRTDRLDIATTRHDTGRGERPYAKLMSFSSTNRDGLADAVTKTGGYFSYPSTARTTMRVALISSYVPQRCGIATFAEDLRGAIVANSPSVVVDVYAVADAPSGIDYPTEVVRTIVRDEWRSYQEAAEQINGDRYDIVCIQHEFGLYGGPEGAFIVDMMRNLKPPVVTTMHTLLADPTTEYHTRTREIIHCSDTVITLSKRGLTLLSHIYHAPMTRATWIPHGIPTIEYTDPAVQKERFGWGNRTVLMTFGLIGPSKGIETMLGALPMIVNDHPDVLYVIAGATHPGVLATHGESYRDGLRARVAALGLHKHVEWVDRYMDDDEVIDYLKACDIYVTPYQNKDQISSGTLSYAVGAGRPVVSTGYWNAVDLLANGRGVLVEFNDPSSIADAVNRLLDDETEMRSISEKAYAYSRAMTWPCIADSYRELFLTLSCRIPKVVSTDQPWSGISVVAPTVSSGV